MIFIWNLIPSQRSKNLFVYNFFMKICCCFFAFDLSDIPVAIPKWPTANDRSYLNHNWFCWLRVQFFDLIYFAISNKFPLSLRAFKVFPNQSRCSSVSFCKQISFLSLLCIFSIGKIEWESYTTKTSDFLLLPKNM